jgi:hopene-associated glycosyltransferase HpnB
VIQFALTVAAAAVWVGLLIAPWRPWSTAERLEPQPGDEDPTIDLSQLTALVPARDEAALIGRTITALARQGRGIEIVVVDDQSTDRTAAVAREAGGERCAVIAGTPVPAGWVGKLWALEQGRERVKTPLILLVDADIELRPGIVPALLRQHRLDSLHLTSLMAVLEMESWWEKLLAPAFVYFFKLLYPFRLSNAPGGLVAAAAGGCMIVDASLLGRIGGFGALRNALIDDCALARHIKKAGGRTWIGLTHAVLSHRPMKTLGSIWQMVERSAYAQLRHSTVLLIGCVAILGLIFWAPSASLLTDSPLTRTVGLIALGAMVLSYVPVLLFYHRSPLWALVLPVTGTLYLLMTVSSAARHWRGTGAHWKGRAYGARNGLRTTPTGM